MDRTIDWTALPSLCELYGVDDDELIVSLLLKLKAAINKERSTVSARP